MNDAICLKKKQITKFCLIDEMIAHEKSTVSSSETYNVIPCALVFGIPNAIFTGDCTCLNFKDNSEVIMEILYIHDSLSVNMM